MRNGRRILIYGMQSSGASLFSLLLGQIPKSVVVVDLWAPFVAPPIQLGLNVVVKATIVEVDYRDHVRSLKPHTTILWLRHPADVIRSLDSKTYRDYGGSLDAKLAKYDQTFRSRDKFDMVLHYETLLAEPNALVAALRSSGLPVPSSGPRFSRSAEEIVSFARASSPWCNRYYRSRWGLGRARTQLIEAIRPIQLPDDEISALSSRCCPAVLEYYKDKFPSDAEGFGKSGGYEDSRRQ